MESMVTIIYRCSYCKDGHGRMYLSKSGCMKHEKRCWLNPARKSCATCDHLFEDLDKEERPYWGCSVMNVIPFKSKVENCPLWEDRGTIFSNDEPGMNRPVERKVVDAEEKQSTRTDSEQTTNGPGF